VGRRKPRPERLIPAGGYQEGELSNFAFNRWVGDVDAAFTWLDPGLRLDLSGSIGFEVDGKNPDTGCRDGNAFDTGVSISESLTKEFSVGLLAGYFDRVSYDSGLRRRDDGFCPVRIKVKDGPREAGFLGRAQSPPLEHAAVKRLETIILDDVWMLGSSARPSNDGQFHGFGSRHSGCALDWVPDPATRHADDREPGSSYSSKKATEADFHLSASFRKVSPITLPMTRAEVLVLVEEDAPMVSILIGAAALSFCCLVMVPAVRIVAAPQSTKVRVTGKPAFAAS
jgi:hypothetical protein